MPCRDNHPDEYTTKLSMQVASQKERLDTLTQLLCSVCKHIEPQEQVLVHVSEVDGLQGWWLDHQEADRVRLAYENQQKVARRVRLELKKREIQREIDGL